MSSAGAMAQSLTLSPYSIFGIGEIEAGDCGHNSGMGGVGIGMSSNGYLNRYNPASLIDLDTMSTLFEVAMSIENSTYKSATEQQKNTNFNFRKLAFGFRANRWWAFSAGLSPYSKMGYKIKTTRDIEGLEDQFDITVEGSGGVNQLYFTNAFAVIPGLTVGVNTSFLFGSLTQNEQLESDYFSDVLYSKTTSTVNSFFFDFGARYSKQLGNFKVNLGAVAGLSNKLHLSSDLLTTSLGGDTLINKTSVGSNVKIPPYWGLGLAATYKGFTLAADARFQDWTNANEGSNVYRYTNSRKFSVGAQYTPDVRFAQRYFDRMIFQAGASYYETYLKLRGEQLKEYTATAGIGWPLFQSNSYIMTSCELGQKGKIQGDLFRNRYYQFNFSIVIKDIWFRKYRYD
jgi:hypothetical protein